jgi:hypothetical protein
LRITAVVFWVCADIGQPQGLSLQFALQFASKSAVRNKKAADKHTCLPQFYLIISQD